MSSGSSSSSSLNSSSTLIHCIKTATASSFQTPAYQERANTKWWITFEIWSFSEDMTQIRAIASTAQMQISLCSLCWPMSPISWLFVRSTSSKRSNKEECSESIFQGPTICSWFTYRCWESTSCLSTSHLPLNENSFWPRASNWWLHLLLLLHRKRFFTFSQCSWYWWRVTWPSDKLLQEGTALNGRLHHWSRVNLLGPSCEPFIALLSKHEHQVFIYRVNTLDQRYHDSKNFVTFDEDFRKQVGKMS